MSFWGCNRRKESDRTVVTIDGYQEVPQSEEALLQAATHQPISVGALEQGVAAAPREPVSIGISVFVFHRIPVPSSKPL